MELGLLAFSEHLEELRKRLKVVFLTLVVVLIVVVMAPSDPSYSFTHPEQYLNLQFLSHTITAAFLNGTVSYILPGNWHLVAATGVGEPMEVYFIASLLLSLVVTMPVIAYETYKFIDPGLTERERKLVYPFVTASALLFVAGTLFGFFVLAKFLIVALSPFFLASSTSYLIDTGAFYYVVFLIIGATGVSFTSPVFVYTLIKLRVVEADFFSRNRVVIWFVLWVITGLFLTPDGGPLLDLVVFVPIVAMVEIAVLLGRRSVKGLPPKRPPDKTYSCPFCGTALGHPELFCEHCGRAIA